MHGSESSTRCVVTSDDGVRLVGELVVPEAAGAAPAALVLNGSGPLDRDSNMPDQVLDIANTLASALAQHGVASLRFDKRGVGKSGGDYMTTGFERETDDAAAALAALREVPGIAPEHVCVIGHSAGATIGVRLASRSDWLAGLVLLSASISSGRGDHALAVGAHRSINALVRTVAYAAVFSETKSG